jgi:hypothetical protein
MSEHSEHILEITGMTWKNAFYHAGLICENPKARDFSIRNETFSSGEIRTYLIWKD